MNTLVLRTDLSGNPSFRELLARVREMALAAYAHQDLPFAKLVESLPLERSQRHNPLFQVWFVLQNAPMAALQLPDLTLTPLTSDRALARHDLKLDLMETPEGIQGGFEYKTDLFDAAAIARMAQQLEQILEAIAAQPDMRLDALKRSLTDGAEQTFKQTRQQKLTALRRRAVATSFSPPTAEAQNESP